MDRALSPFSPFVDPHYQTDHGLARTALVSRIHNMPHTTGQKAVRPGFCGAVLVRIPRTEDGFGSTPRPISQSGVLGWRGEVADELLLN